MAETWRKIAFTDNPVFTGVVETPAIKITTGKGASKVLTSDADGNGTWQDASGAPGNPADIIPYAIALG